MRYSLASSTTLILALTLSGCIFSTTDGDETGDTGDTSSDSGDGDSATTTTSTGDGDSGDGDASTGDGDSGDGDSGDGDSGDGDSGDGDSGDGDSGDGDSGDGDGDGDGDSTTWGTGDGDGDDTTTGDGDHTLDRQINNGDDDSEENEDGNITIDSSDLEMVDDFKYWGGNQVVGLRFTNMIIPAGSTINSAYIEFTADDPSNDDTTLEIRGEADADAAPFTSQDYDLSTRASTTSSTDWPDIAPWDTQGATHQSPDISGVVQELIDQGGWASGNAMAFLIRGSGKREATSWNGAGFQAPTLHVEWSEP
jgi:hypothetical protein